MHDDFPTALGLAAAIRAREISPSEALAETLRRLDERNPALNAVVWRDDDEARDRARVADDLVASTDPGDLPPFCGVPLPIKDLTDVAGWPNTYGSTGAGLDPADENELIVDAFEGGGFVLTGRTNTPEFGSITATENERYGITRNPWALDRTPGGSSGGAAAATAAGMYALAHASDGGGSIRIPASCCGLVGLKASRGRVPSRLPGWEGASTEGAVTHTVADTAAILDLISTADPYGWSNAPAAARPFVEELDADQAPLRVAVVTDTALGLPTAPACQDAVAAAAAALAEAGHTIVDASPDLHIDEFVGHFVTVLNAELGLLDDAIDWARAEAHNRLGREAAGEVDSAAYARAVAALRTWTRRVNRQWGDGFDVLLTPTMAIEPAPAGQILAEVQADPGGVSPTVLHSVLFTAVFNMNGLPAISVPTHQADSGLPIGTQLVGAPWDEATLLRLAAHLEQSLPWRDRHPTL
jgi:amidase